MSLNVHVQFKQAWLHSPVSMGIRKNLCACVLVQSSWTIQFWPIFFTKIAKKKETSCYKLSNVDTEGSLLMLIYEVSNKIQNEP